jgi:heterogeneous nuclear ribonucleoprotein A1/A3
LDYFRRYGRIQSINLIKTSDKKHPKRFAIITFNKRISAEILEKEHSIGNRLLDVKEYMHPEEAKAKLSSEKARKIFVGGLHVAVDEANLRNYFSKFGKVVDCNIVYNHESQVSRGFGFVIFQDEKTVHDVLDRYNDHYLYGKWVRLSDADRSEASHAQGGTDLADTQPQELRC